MALAPDPSVGSDRDDREDGPDHGISDLGILLAALTVGAGIIHLAVALQHAGTGAWIDPVGFALVGWVQVLLAAMLLVRKGGRSTVLIAGAVNAAAVVVWAASRTVGLPFGSHAEVVEAVGLLDGICAGIEVVAVLVAVSAAFAPRRSGAGRVLAAVGAVAVVALVTFGLVAPGDEGVDAGAVGGHVHAGGSDDASHAGAMAVTDRTRCDLGFNPRSYWTEAAAMGVDTYGGGTMAMTGSAPGASAPRTAPDDGRGSAGLDRLVAATSRADSGGEMDAAGLVAALAGASEEDHAAWTAYMRRRAAATGGAHSHGAATTTTVAPPTTTLAPTTSKPVGLAGQLLEGRSAGPVSGIPAPSPAAAPDDNGGHGGHIGPQPWTAMVDQEQCVQLAEELAEARKVALSMPTAASAMAAGYVRVTPYVDGIAAHYMKFSEVDDEFHLDRPEMVLYDGNGPDAHVVGLSYYILHPGDAEPNQGFTGDEDHYHRHVGLCVARDRGVIGDSTTSAADCAARGGIKAGGGSGWMSHVWVVPGCESPWGVFSGANPILDPALSASSGTNDGGCAGSAARSRYDLRPGTRASVRAASRSRGG